MTTEVGDVLSRAARRMTKLLRRRGITEPNDADDADPEGNLAASAVSGQVPPAGPQWKRGLSPLRPAALSYDNPLCASLDGFTLHAATPAGALDTVGREPLLRYVLRPPIAQTVSSPAPMGWYASHSNGRTATARRRWTWIRSRSSAGSSRASRRLGSIR